MMLGRAVLLFAMFSPSGRADRSRGIPQDVVGSAGDHVHELPFGSARPRIVEPVVHLVRIVGEVVELAGSRDQIDGELAGAGADGAKVELDPAARRAELPFAEGEVARFGPL